MTVTCGTCHFWRLPSDATGRQSAAADAKATRDGKRLCVASKRSVHDMVRWTRRRADESCERHKPHQPELFAPRDAAKGEG